MPSLLPFRKLGSLCYVALASSLIIQADASMVPTSGETQILGTSLIGDQTSPQAALDATGGYIVWTDNSVTPLGSRIKAQRLDSNFASVGTPVVVSSGWKSKTSGDQEKPQVALLKNGQGAVLVWQGGKVGFQQIFIRYIDSNGIPVRSDVRVSTQTKCNQVDPVVTTLVDGTVLVVWTSFGPDGSMFGVFGQLLTPDGIKIGVEFPINKTTANNQRSPSLTALDNGNFAVAWISELQQGTASVGVYCRIFDAQGAALTEELAVNQGSNSICANPSIAGSTGGGFAVTWAQKAGNRFAVPSDSTDPTGIDDPLTKGNAVAFSSTTRSSDSWDVLARTFDPTGAAIVEPFRLNTYVYGDQFAPKVAASGTNYFAVWTSLQQDGDSREGVFGQEFLPDGVLSGAEVHVNTTVINRQFQPAIVSDGTDRFLAIWSGFIAHYGFDLFSRTYVPTP